MNRKKLFCVNWPINISKYLMGNFLSCAYSCKITFVRGKLEQNCVTFRRTKFQTYEKLQLARGMNARRASHFHLIAIHSRLLDIHSLTLASRSFVLASRSHLLANHSSLMASHFFLLASRSPPLTSHSLPLASHSPP